MYTKPSGFAAHHGAKGSPFETGEARADGAIRKMR